MSQNHRVVSSYAGESIHFLRAEAKRLRKRLHQQAVRRGSENPSITLCQAEDNLAQERGYCRWSELLQDGWRSLDRGRLYTLSHPEELINLCFEDVLDGSGGALACSLENTDLQTVKGPVVVRHYSFRLIDPPNEENAGCFFDPNVSTTIAWERIEANSPLLNPRRALGEVTQEIIDRFHGFDADDRAEMLAAIERDDFDASIYNMNRLDDPLRLWKTVREHRGIYEHPIFATQEACSETGRTVLIYPVDSNDPEDAVFLVYQNGVFEDAWCSSVEEESSFIMACKTEGLTDSEICQRFFEKRDIDEGREIMKQVLAESGFYSVSL